MCNVDPQTLLEGNNLQAKSLWAYCQKYQPEIAIRSSMSNYREQNWMVNVPLYMLASYLNQ